MNIFALDTDPRKAAEYHVDKHVVKMILELCQILSTAHRVLDGWQIVKLSNKGRRLKAWSLKQDPERDNLLYSATHVNHPSCVYARSTSFAYEWTYSLLVELCKEYTYRYGKIHKCQEIGLVDALSRMPDLIKIDESVVYPTPAMPDEFKNSDVITAYRNYYRGAKQRMASWSGKINSRPTPEWYYENNV